MADSGITDGWIEGEWEASPLPPGAVVDMRLADGSVLEGEPADRHPFWSRNLPCSVIAYRIVQ